MYQCQLKFHWSSFLKARLTKFQHWFRKWLGADQATSQYLNQWWFDYWRIYASLGLNKLILILVANSLYLTWPVHNVSFICHPYDWHWSHANFCLIALSVCSAISSHFLNTQKSILNALHKAIKSVVSVVWFQWKIQNNVSEYRRCSGLNMFPPIAIAL